MKTLSAENLKLKEAIKSLLKRNGQKQEALAKFLGLSLPMVRKVLNSDDFTLERLIKISAFLNLSIYELIEISKVKEFDKFTYTIEQDKFLAQNIVNVIVLIKLVRFQKFDHILKDLKISKRSLESILINLDRLNLVRYRDQNSISLTPSWPFKMIPKGPQEKKYIKKWFQIVWDKVTTNCEFSIHNSTEENSLHRFEVICHPSTIKKFKDDLNELLTQLQLSSKIDRAKYKSDDLEYSSFIALIGKFSGWESLYHLSK